MGLIALVVFGGGLLACCVGLLIHKVARRSERKHIYVVLGMVITSIVVVSNAQNILDHSTNLGFDVSAEEANKHLITFKLPSEATSVNYQSNVFLGTIDVADFTINENVFLAWTAQNGWKTERFITEKRLSNQEQSPGHVPNHASLYTVEFTPRLAVPVKSFMKGEEGKYVEIHNGYSCSTIGLENGRADYGKEIYYDLDTSRAYIKSSTR